MCIPDYFVAGAAVAAESFLVESAAAAGAAAAVESAAGAAATVVESAAASVFSACLLPHEDNATTKVATAKNVVNFFILCDWVLGL
jgi:hypothetical protein